MERKHSANAFTLIELMVVVAILAIILTISIPFVRMAIDSPRGINGAVRLIEDACRDARAKAILDQAPVALVIRPAEGSFDITGAPAASNQIESPDLAGNEWRQPERSGARSSGGTEFKRPYPAKLAPEILIEGIGVNGGDATDEDTIYVEFRSNGTSDAFTIIIRSMENEYRNVWLDIVTGLPEVETDRYKFHAR